jgi:hypothetical protein
MSSMQVANLPEITAETSVCLHYILSPRGQLQRSKFVESNILPTVQLEWVLERALGNSIFFYVLFKGIVSRVIRLGHRTVLMIERSLQMLECSLVVDKKIIRQSMLGVDQAEAFTYK